MKSQLNRNKTTTNRAQPTTTTRNPPARLPGARVTKDNDEPQRFQEETNQGTSERTLKSSTTLLAEVVSESSIYRDHN